MKVNDRPKTIRIPDKLMDQWNALRGTSDVAILADLCQTFKTTIYRVFENHQATEEHFEIIADFYKGKQELIDKYISDYND